MILYFSGTGNSRHVARTIARISGDEILSINQRLKTRNHTSISSEKPLVFVGPVYAGRLPRVMEDFIRQVTFQGTKEAYFVVTCAQTPWATVNYVQKLCKEKSFRLLGFHSIVMPQGYIAGGGTQPKEINDQILKKAEPDIQETAQSIRDKKRLPQEKPGKALMSNVLNPIMYAVMIHAKAFHVTDSCTSCGKCETRCPLNNVTLVNGKPTWGKNCTHCMACIAGCPSGAIEYGKKTKGKPRYYLEEL